MNLPTELYASQCARWPNAGEHILAHHDEETIVVYQAYRPSIGNYAIEHGRFGGPDFSLQRMSWIKPNFLWMMYRSGWGTKEGQEVILGLRIRRAFFDSILAQAVASTYQPHRHLSRETWKTAVDTSEVRLQWDPDHDPQGAKVNRRAVQLGLRGHTLEAFATDELIEVINMTPFVSEQRPYASAGDVRLRTPAEGIYVSGELLSMSAVSPKK
jgi:Domain of unknown function (DUF4291)